MNNTRPKPKYVLESYKGFYQRTDGWGNAIWTTDVEKAWSSENFHDASIEAQVRDICREAHIVDATLFPKKK